VRYLSVCSGIEAATVAWHPLGWQAAAYSEIEKFPRAVLRTITPTFRCMATSRRSEATSMDLFTSLSGEPPARTSQSRDFARELLASEATSPSSFYGWLRDWSRVGSSGRTFPASCRRTEDGRLEPSSEGWQSSGMGSPTGFLTLSTSAWPSDGRACSLSDILETGDVPQRFFLSAKACKGILRRAGKRGKNCRPR
jgi:hypothetical protein